MYVEQLCTVLVHRSCEPRCELVLDLTSYQYCVGNAHMRMLKCGDSIFRIKALCGINSAYLLT